MSQISHADLNIWNLLQKQSLVEWFQVKLSVWINKPVHSPHNQRWNDVELHIICQIPTHSYFLFLQTCFLRSMRNYTVRYKPTPYRNNRPQNWWYTVHFSVFSFPVSKLSLTGIFCPYFFFSSFMPLVGWQPLVWDSPSFMDHSMQLQNRGMKQKTLSMEWLSALFGQLLCVGLSMLATMVMEVRIW